MRSWILTLRTVLILVFLAVTSAQTRAERVIFAMHGGAGTISRANLPADLESDYREQLRAALQTGFDLISEGGSALDAVEAAIRVLEDSPLFNAGRGAVFNAAGEHELDASIMNGSDLTAGAVAGVQSVKNPISLARLVMERTPHVILSGAGAGEFAAEQNVPRREPDYFYTIRRWEALEKARRKSGAIQEKGTVGAVALDQNGNLAAGTSTGGMTNKHYGRIGDSPVIGAGTYADNRTCAVSATGHGEHFIRLAVAHEISALIDHTGISVQSAADRVIHEKLTDLGGTGGVIALDAHGNLAMPFNTPGMYRGWVTETGKITIKIYQD